MQGYWLQKINEKFSSLLIFLIPLSFVVGYFTRGFMPHLKWTAPHMLFTIMFTSVWSLRWGDFVEIKKYKSAFALGMLGQLLLLPLVAILIAEVFFGVSEPYGVGQLCVSVSPAAISTIIWSSITGGDIALGIVLVGAHVFDNPFLRSFCTKAYFGKKRPVFIDRFVYQAYVVGFYTHCGGYISLREISQR